MISLITLHAKHCPASDLIHDHAASHRLICSNGLLMLYELELCPVLNSQSGISQGKLPASVHMVCVHVFVVMFRVDVSHVQEHDPNAFCVGLATNLWW